jgi:hypothetical protein
VGRGCLPDNVLSEAQLCIQCLSEAWVYVLFRSPPKRLSTYTILKLISVSCMFSLHCMVNLSLFP